jgi:hypothetical protein
MTVLDEELREYEARRAELVRSALGKWVLIKGHEVLGTFDAEMDAVRHGFRTLGHVPFFVRRIAPVDLPLIVTHVAL